MKNRAKRKGQRGMALVMVLGVLAVTMLMVAHIMTICELASKDAYVAAERSLMRYEAESAVARTFWMHLVDRNYFSNRKMGSEDDSRVGTVSFEPYMADRRPHEPFERATTYIGTVEKSISLTNTSSFKANVDVDDTDTLEIINDFLDVLGDYTDTDSARKFAGMEQDDYDAEGIPSLPRNGAIQFREELYWMPGWQDAVIGEVTIVPPRGKSFSSSSSSNSTTKPSFFSASAADIQRLLDLSDAELETVLDAREQWMLNGTTLEDSLSADLLLNIQNQFNFNESNVAEYIASVKSPDGSFRQILRVVRECDLSKSTIYADKNSETFSIWTALSW